ncbi:hypothetical protein [Spiribacter pallidus]|uniref:Uncharacterized protein n=1 Tax=Spiribacter pallidus TaxID=1987936 RepID=A0ABV3T9F3_9GAMM
MAEQGTTPREQLVLRHRADSDGDWLVEVGKNNPRRWQSVVEDITLTLTSVRAFVERSFVSGDPIAGADTSVDADFGDALTLSGVSQQADDGTQVYGIDISEDDAEYLIAQRVDSNIGIDLIGRTPEAFQEDSPKSPYISEVFVSTDGWYYGDAESVQLLFDVPEADLRQLYDVFGDGKTERLELQISLKR